MKMHLDEVEIGPSLVRRLLEAPFLPLPVPAPLARGAPTEEYAWTWAVYSWLDGENATPDRLVDARQRALDLAAFIAALQRIDPTGGPGPGEHNFCRGEPLALRNAAVRASLETLRGELDVAAVSATWEAALAARPSGIAGASGSTATWTLATCSRTRAGSARSSTGALSEWAIPRAT